MEIKSQMIRITLIDSDNLQELYLTNTFLEAFRLSEQGYIDALE